jgi:flagellar biosynthesis GTPase FlhF
MSTGGGGDPYVEILRPTVPVEAAAAVDSEQTDGKEVGELHAINFKDDWSGDFTMPRCAEKTLALVVRYLDCLKSGRRPKKMNEYEKQLEDKYRQLDTKNAQLLEIRMIHCLVEQAQRERFPEYQVSLMQNALDAVQKHNLEQGVETLRQILKNTRKFDIDVALKIIDECSKVAKDFEGKDVFLVIGATGAGNLLFDVSTFSQTLSRQIHSAAVLGWIRIGRSNHR